MVKLRLSFVALGDSLTVGFQPPSMYLPDMEEFPYTQFLETILFKELPKKGLDDVEVTFKNSGMNGDTTRGMLERLDAHVFSSKPDYVIVWGGINDLMMLRPPEEAFANLAKIYEKARDAGVRVIACTLTPIMNYNEVKRRIIELNDMIKRYCDPHGIPVADLFKATADNSGELREAFSSDGVHLSNAGYQRVANTIYYDVIEQILNGLTR
jgi:lysophospholipase L1-like esterase